MKIKRVCVFCGAKAGNSPEYLQSAEALAEEMGKRGINLVYGGGGIGMMGAVARSCLKAGLEVDGVIPTTLIKAEVELKECTRLHEVESMHERKSLMNELCDGFITLPGGIGSLEELFEVLTWSYLGIHSKPVALLNVKGYYDQLIAFLDRAVSAGFLTQVARDALIVSSDPAELLDMMERYSHKGLGLSWEPKTLP